MIASERTLHVAVIKAYEVEESYGQEAFDLFTQRAKSQGPNISVDSFRPIIDGKLPSPMAFDLIIISGGLTSLMETPFPDWVTATFNMIKQIATTQTRAKLVGVCWGHQAIAVALGGQIAEQGFPGVGVKGLPLTDAGANFFGQSILRISKFHRKIVSNPALGFTDLAEKNEVLFSDSGNILSFQGHPEVYGALGQTLFLANRKYYYPKDNEEEAVQKAKERIWEKEDGEIIFRKIMDWVKEDWL